MKVVYAMTAMKTDRLCLKNRREGYSLDERESVIPNDTNDNERACLESNSRSVELIVK